MLNNQVFLHDSESIKKSMRRRGIDEKKAEQTVSRIQSLLQQRKSLYIAINREQLRRKSLTSSFNNKENEYPSSDQIELKASKSRLEVLEKQINTIRDNLHKLLIDVPNIITVDTPQHSTTIREWHPQNDKGLSNQACHYDIGNVLREIDTESASQMATNRFSFLKGSLAHLHRALANFMLDHHIKAGYEEVWCPVIANEKALFNSGQFPKFAKSIYKIDGKKDLYLIPTGEVSLINLFANKLLVFDELPKKLVTMTSCFRLETGGYGSTSRGLIRQHQFDKVEIVQFTHPLQEQKTLHDMVGQAEHILQLLEIPYRILYLSGLDLSFTAHTGYDIECWRPPVQSYMEVSSCSACGDFQARRMNTRFRDQDGRSRYVATLNASGLAVGRTLVALLENHQENNGVRVPQVLQPYCKTDFIPFSLDQ